VVSNNDYEFSTPNSGMIGLPKLATAADYCRRTHQLMRFFFETMVTPITNVKHQPTARLFVNMPSLFEEIQIVSGGWFGMFWHRKNLRWMEGVPIFVKIF
jgi:hypothetical protein